MESPTVGRAQSRAAFVAGGGRLFYPRCHFAGPLRHLGDHLRARRTDLGLPQRDVANRLGVHATSVRNWEAGRTAVTLNAMLRMIGFLRYNPRPEASSVAEQIKRWRTAQGLSQKRTARQMGVDPSTFARWESGRRDPKGPYRLKVDRFSSTLPTAYPSAPKPAQRRFCTKTTSTALAHVVVGG